MDDRNTGPASQSDTTDPICTVCSEPVTDDGERAFVRAPGCGDALDEAQILYHHESCEREGRLFLTPS